MAGRGRGREMTLPAWMTQGPGPGVPGDSSRRHDRKGGERRVGKEEAKLEREAEEAVMRQQEWEMKRTISQQR